MQRGLTGSIDLTVSGGVSPYTYSWTGGATTQDRSGLAAGTYTVTVADANACTKTLSTTITEPAGMVLTETHANVLCNGGSSGSIDLTVSGGVSPYTYSWTGGATTQDRSGLAAGTYTVTVTDANACTKTLSTTITEPTWDGADGDARERALQRRLDWLDRFDGVWRRFAVHLFLDGRRDHAGSLWPCCWHLHGDRHGRERLHENAFNDHHRACRDGADGTHVNVLCNGGSTGSIDLTVSGGVSPYTYSWTGGATTQTALALRQAPTR
ncbi:MAG: hypothetical protein IPH31_16185 [Lewinellaceae bacterium]|nr:hypothetical protein [Lewinellaceae bacterium]